MKLDEMTYLGGDGWRIVGNREARTPDAPPKVVGWHMRMLQVESRWRSHLQVRATLSAPRAQVQRSFGENVPIRNVELRNAVWRRRARSEAFSGTRKREMG